MTPSSTQHCSSITHPVGVLPAGLDGCPVPALVLLLVTMATILLDGDVRHVLLPQHHQLDLVASLLDDPHGVVHVAGRLGVDRQDLVVLADAVTRGLAWKKTIS